MSVESPVRPPQHFDVSPQRPSTLKEWILGLYHGAKVIWLCGFCTVALLFAAFAFIGNDQGRDLLRMLAEPLSAASSLSSRVSFFIAVTCWSLATWYATRVLVSRRLQGFPLPQKETRLWRVATPRVLGTAAPLIIAVAFLHLAILGDSPLELRFRLAGALYGALSVVLGVFYWRRRKWFPDLTGKLPAYQQLNVLPETTRRILTVSLGLSLLLLLLFVAFPVGPARLLGTPALFILAAASIQLFGSIILNYVPLASGYPGLLLPVLVIAILFSPFNDNHVIRTADSQATPSKTFTRPLPIDHFTQWLSLAERREKERTPAAPDAAAPAAPFPVFIVAAAGGGIRAAYWTARVLGAAADKVGAPAWRDHLYALSGVSGGSLGAGVHVVDLARFIDDRDFAARARLLLGQDHLSPDIAYLLFPDLVQRFLPVPIPGFDRARALEASWESSTEVVLKTSVFSSSFQSLWSIRPNEVPALLLNSTRVETGQRAIVTNLNLTYPQSDFMDAVDLLDSKLALAGFDRLRLSSAIHLSARFTYVSPAARAEHPNSTLWGRLVDGGYFENSGAATAADLIRAIHLDGRCPSASCQTPAGVPRRAIPVVLLIKNDPKAPSICHDYAGPEATPRGFFTEIEPPLQALLATREARGRLSERAILRLINPNGDPDGSCENGCVLELSLAKSLTNSTPSDESRSPVYNDPPLGWSLSEPSRLAMDDRLSAPDTQSSLQCIANLIQGQSCATALMCKR
jgi:hypothetical protein